MPKHSSGYPVRIAGEIAVELLDLAEETLRETVKQRRIARRRRVGATLRPGHATPLWNELVQQAKPFLAPRGAKSKLARQLGISRQRLRHCLKAQHACLDAERTLLLLCWVMAHREGRPLAFQAEPDL